ncbi:acyltransferase family protein [Luteimonas sp. gir]|uniref:acyltransferase family protein n=1 Tax=Luteimonas sp. gir TaxID=3127960 RepID=UPI003075CD49
MASQKYRPDIDGLRSLAILPVLLYHAGFPGFSGGFVGVDVFFVISGYLITSILIREFAEETYSVFSFYERRIRRIFPALLTVLAFVLAASPIFLLPSEFLSLGRDTVSALFFVANINFWRQSGYFAADAEAKPLLHMWSLGVEEQFYLIAPLLLFLVLRYAPRYGLLLVGAGLLASWALCVYLTPSKPSGSFYLLPTRAWELLAGAWLALLMIGRTSSPNAMPWRDNALGLIGLFLILFPVFTYSKNTVFPGYAATVPVLGAALLIFSGQHSWTGRFLSLRPLVLIGLISYSLYLWHWPLIVMFRNLGWLGSSLGKVAVVVLSCAAAWATWRWIETPTRNRTAFTPHRLGLLVGACSALVVASSLFYTTLDGWPSRLPANVLAFDMSRNDVSPARTRCHFDGGAPDLSRACVLGDGAPQVAVWGDSHGVELAQAISEQGIPVREITYSACPPALGRTARSDRPLCPKHNERVFDFLVSDASIRTVVLASYYGIPFSASRELQEQLAYTAAELNAAGKRVVIIGPYPSIDGHVDVPTYLARGGRRDVVFDTTGIASFRGLVRTNANLVLPTEAFCRNGHCDLVIDDTALLFDAHHPSMHAAREIAKRLAPILRDNRDE